MSVLRSYNFVLYKEPCEHESLLIDNFLLIIIYVKRNKKECFTASSFQLETAVIYATQSHCKYSMCLYLHFCKTKKNSDNFYSFPRKV